MGRQKSQQSYHKASRSHNNRRRSGTLFIVGVPIGCPEDLTLRARRVLGQVSIVVAEAPLAARALLDFHGIAATITGYGRGEPDRIAIFLDRLNAGHDIALVSDSGMPVIYDPGRLLIAAARASGYRITVVPGPSALTAAASLSGESGDRLVFVGQLPRSTQRLDRLFSTLNYEVGTTVMFASASVLPRILRRISRILPERRITLAVNMTTPDERLYQGAASALLAHAQDLSQDSEVTLVLSGARKKRK
jgi:16S rRNA (cytidine1402-2'-O)-methyltransferase